MLVPAHGGTLTPLRVAEEVQRDEIRRVGTLPRIHISSKEASDLLMLSMGAFSPLQGFATKEDYHSVLEDMHLRTGVMWPIPITLSVSPEQASRIGEGDEIVLVEPERRTAMATMVVEEAYPADKAKEAACVFGTSDRAHPGVDTLYGQGAINLGGPVRVLHEQGYPERYSEYMSPAQTRRVFSERGWSTVAALQTRNPMHRSHEYLAKIALEVSDGLLIHPIVGRLKPGDLPADLRLACYRALIENYFPAEQVVLGVYPMEMRYAGPREALLHAIIRQNYGCSHLIVGRDHAGVGNFYGPFDAQRIFDTLVPGDLCIKPLKLDVSFWCHRCGSMASNKTCPHGPEDRLAISGTELRRLLTTGSMPPHQFSRPEVLEILRVHYMGGGV